MTKQANRFGGAQVVAAVVTVCLAAVLVACQTTPPTRRVQAQGFLRSYSQLREGKGKEAQLIYISPSANWQRYDSIMIDSVTIWYSSKTSEIPAEDRKALTDLLYASLQKQLGRDYDIVKYPGPRTMRLRAAITEEKGARFVGRTVTTVVPQARLLSTLTDLATDTQVFVGEAALEAEITDSMTSKRLAAAVDERAGAKTLRGPDGEWKDVGKAFYSWAKKIRKRLAELRAEG